MLGTSGGRGIATLGAANGGTHRQECLLMAPEQALQAGQGLSFWQGCTWCTAHLATHRTPPLPYQAIHIAPALRYQSPVMHHRKAHRVQLPPSLPGRGMYHDPAMLGQTP